MDTLNQLIAYYKMFPSMAMLRTLELKQFMSVRDLCAQPILDLACGDGFMAKLAFGHSVDIGLDLNIECLKEALHQGSYRIVINADARYLPFKDKTFRTVYSNSAMEHMDDLDAILEEIARILTSDGISIILVPSHRFLKPVGRIAKFFGQIIWDRYNRLQNHVNLLDEGQWRSILRKHGLKVKSISPYCSYAIAKYIFDLELCGKFHFDFHWPFLHLRHLGNLGLLIGRISLPYLKHIFATHPDSSYEGHCFMILTVKV